MCAEDYPVSVTGGSAGIASLFAVAVPPGVAVYVERRLPAYRLIKGAARSQLPVPNLVTPVPVACDVQLPMVRFQPSALLCSRKYVESD